MRRISKDLPELLAPAGSPDALAAAIEGGADAVYFGAVKFSARMRAKNFDDTQLREAIALCRAYGVRSYITVNTRLRDTELPEMLDTVGILHEAGADALIVADLGAAAQIHSRYPDLELHASTQLSGCSSADAQVLQGFGFSRMVCPRELSLVQISRLCDASPLEIEMFVHGAHCVSYSGQCMLSYAMGGRSGNRGECAQPCRLPYAVSCAGCANKNAYPLSLKDMCLADHIREIILSGAASLKLEGRQKSPDYVWGVTKMYRKLLDEKRDAEREEIEELAALFSRDGFSDGYFRHRYTDMLGIRRPDDTDSSKSAPAFPGLTKKLPLTGHFRLMPGEAAYLSLQCGKRTAVVTGEIPQPARTAALTEESAKKNLTKFGGTAYILQSLTTEIGEGLFYTPAALNDLRRRATAALSQPPARRVCTISDVRPAPIPISPVRYTAEFLSPEQIPAEAEGFFDEIYLPLRCRARDYSVLLPSYATDATLRQAEAALDIVRPRSVLAQGLAQLAMAKRLGIPAVASLRLNVFNDRCAHAIADLGAALVTPSPEIPLGAVRDMTVPRALVVYGRLPLMLTLRCAISDGGKVCGFDRPGGFREEQEKDHLCRASLTDRMGTAFPMIGMYDCTNVLYNSVPLYMADRTDILTRTGAQVHHFIFSTESRAEAANIIRAYREGLPPAIPTAVRRLK